MYDSKEDFAGIHKAVLNIKDIINILEELKSEKRYITGFKRPKAEHFKLLTADGRLIFSEEEFAFLKKAGDNFFSQMGNKKAHTYLEYFTARYSRTNKEQLIIHAHSRGYRDFKGLGWVLMIENEIKELFAPVIQLRWRILTTSLIVTILAAVMYFLVSRSITNPVKKLRDAALRIGKGQWDSQIEVESNDEIGDLAKSFKTMTNDLKQTATSITKLNKKIIEHNKAERKLRKKTYDLNERVKELNCFYGLSGLASQPNISLEEIFQGTVNLIPPAWQYPDIICARIIFDGKEFYTDNFKDSEWNQKADIKVDSKSVGAIEIYYLEERPDADIGPFLKEEKLLIEALAERLGKITERKWYEKQKSSLEKRLYQAKKLEAIGTLAAGIAHEINTPLQYIGDNIRFFNEAIGNLFKQIDTYRYLLTKCSQGEETKPMLEKGLNAKQELEIDYLKEEIPKGITQTQDGLERVTKIVNAMRDFSHMDSSTGIKEDINEAIESTITVLSNEWKYVVDIKTDFEPDLPLVYCFLGDINQALMNLIVNAVQAIADVVGDGSKGKGKITITTRRKDNSVLISVADTGSGIPEDIRDRIFDPFFTTKAVGKGTGQGLSIAYNAIVEKHGGKLTFNTEMGKGTEFLIELPIDEK